MSLGLLCMLIVFVNLMAGALIVAFAVSRDASNTAGSPIRRSFLYFFPVMGPVVALLLAAFVIGAPTKVVVHQVGSIPPPSAVAVPGTTQGDLASANAYEEGPSAGASLAAQVEDLAEPVSRYSGRPFVVLTLVITAVAVLAGGWITTVLPSRRYLPWLGSGALVLLLVALVVPGIQQMREGDRRRTQLEHLRKIGQQLHDHGRHQDDLGPRVGDSQPPLADALRAATALPGDSRRLDVSALPSAGAVASALQPLNRQSDLSEANEGSAPEPHWLSAGPETANGTTILVFKSGQYATEQEARTDADGQLFHAVTTDLAQYRRERWLSLRPEPLTVDKVRHYVLASHVQSVTRDFGTFRAPMHRVWYQVEFSPRMREPLLASPSSLDRDARLQLVLTALVALFLVPFGIVTTGAARRRAPGFVGTTLSLLVGVSLVAVWFAMAWKLNQIVVLW